MSSFGGGQCFFIHRAQFGASGRVRNQNGSQLEMEQALLVSPSTPD
jgi:hypothetical protein